MHIYTLSELLIFYDRYFEDLVTAAANLQNNTIDPAKYLPQIGEENLEDVSFEPLAARKVIFKSLKFVFFNLSELGKMQNLIELAGGQHQVFHKTKHLNLKFLNDHQDLVFMSEEGRPSEEQVKLVGLLVGLKRRVVDQTEIGLAILYASIEKHCCQFKSTYYL